MVELTQNTTYTSHVLEVYWRAHNKGCINCHSFEFIQIFTQPYPTKICWNGGLHSFQDMITHLEDLTGEPVPHQERRRILRKVVPNYKGI